MPAPMLILSIIWALSSCSTPEETLPTTVLGLTNTGPATGFNLAQMDATYELPPSNLPGSFNAEVEFHLPLRPNPTPRGFHRNGGYVTELPFVLTDVNRRFGASGLIVEVDGMEVPFSTAYVLHDDVNSWRINKRKQLIVLHPVPPLNMEVTLRAPKLKSTIERHTFENAGLEASAFVQYSMAHEQYTRQGLLLPAPATGSWDLTLPNGTVNFESYLSLEKLPFQEALSDGASVVLGVHYKGEYTEVDQIALDPDSMPFQRWRKDLSQWAGKTVTLEIRTLPGDNKDYDYVFLGSPSVWKTNSQSPRRVVVIGMDTTRPDHFSGSGYKRPTSTALDAFGETAAIFTNAWTPAPRTRPSFRSAFTGRTPLDAVGATNIAEVFSRNGFVTAGFAANIHLQSRFDFDKGFDAWLHDGKATAQEQLDRALQWLELYPNRDSYLFLHLMDPHIFYRAPGSYKNRFVENADPDLPRIFNRWEVYRWNRLGELSDVRKAHIKALYDGEIAYTTERIAKLMETLDQMSGETLVIIHSDHGEEFWDHGGFEHNHSLYSELTSAVFWIRPSGGFEKGMQIDTPVTLADIAPTLYDLFGFTDLPETDGLSVSSLLTRQKSTEDWNRPIGIAHLRYGSEQWGVVWKDHKYILHTASGDEELYNLSRDPGETDNIALNSDLNEYRKALGQAHNMPVVPGWRIRTDVRTPGEPFIITLPQPCLRAEIMDPESTTNNRANLVWGEPPRKIKSQVGTLSLSDDKKVLTFNPSTEGQGILIVEFPEPQLPDAVVVYRNQEKEMAPNNAPKKANWRTDDNSRIVIDMGTILFPPPGEAVRMRALQGEQQNTSADEYEMLEALGYIGGDH